MFLDVLNTNISELWTLCTISRTIFLNMSKYEFICFNKGWAWRRSITITFFFRPLQKLPKNGQTVVTGTIIYNIFRVRLLSLKSRCVRLFSVRHNCSSKNVQIIVINYIIIIILYQRSRFDCAEHYDTYILYIITKEIHCYSSRLDTNNKI